MMTTQRYTRSAIFLHWALALLLAFQLSLGWRLEDFPRGYAGFAAFQLHKSVGILILALTVLRIAVRLTRPRPALMVDSPWARTLAHLVHLGLYGFMLGAPLTGWAIVSTSKIKLPTLLFGTVPLPHLPLPAAFNGPSGEAHEILGYIGVALFVLHVAGALRHQFAKHENILGRMTPGLPGDRVPAGKAALAAVVALAAVGLSLFAAKAMQFPASPPSAPTTDSADMASAPASDEPGLAPEESTAAAQAAPSEDASMAATEAVVPSAWAIDKSSRLGFTARWNGDAVTGTFTAWDAAVTFDPKALTGSSVRVSVDLASAATADSQRDEMLKGGDFFDVAAHPKATFTSRTIRAAGGNRYVADGTLSLHGANRPASLRFTVDIAGDKAKAAGTTTIDRTTFGVGSGEWAATDQIAGAVVVNFAITAKRKP
jgi:cytochrome b561/polyisoprenoid-binding protein YceI